MQLYYIVHAVVNCYRELMQCTRLCFSKVDQHGSLYFNRRE